MQVFVDSVKNRIDEVDKDNVDVSKLRMHIRKKFSYMQAQKGEVAGLNAEVFANDYFSKPHSYRKYTFDCVTFVQVTDLTQTLGSAFKVHLLLIMTAATATTSCSGCLRLQVSCVTAARGTGILEVIA